ncbi:MAG: septal ring lytic transglycosylase RlpA family protein [Desulfovibrio sp.]|nr:septal ring lytic transglycosylase RlpA family protein [Desulfovibrio sp.]
MTSVKTALCLLGLLHFLAFQPAAALSKEHRQHKRSAIHKEFAQNVTHGKCVWYSGRKDAKTPYTAAHRTLPFGTRVLVTNRKNNRSVLVLINDRGPVSHKFVIDISRAAAAKIGMINDGIADVTLKVEKAQSHNQRKH